MAASPSSVGRILLGELDIHVTGAHWDCTLPATFFQNCQMESSLWAEVAPTRLGSLFAEEVEITCPGYLEPFQAVLGGRHGEMKAGAMSFHANIIPLRLPLESTPAGDLKEVTFALLDSPISGL